MAINKIEKGITPNSYIEQWSKLSKKIDPYTYPLFSKYIDNYMDIVPEDVGITYIEPLLNPIKMRPFYSDKNMYEKYMNFNKGLIKGIIRRIAGGVQLLDVNYNKLELTEEGLSNIICQYDKLILKPTIDTDSGKGIKLFIKKGNTFISHENETLTLDYLMSYNDDFVLQEYFNQHSFFSQFNENSVNTIRICTLRSVKDDHVFVTGAIMRIGKTGNFLDNAHAGGRYVGINIDNGKIGKTTLDQFGTKIEKWNGIDFRSSEFIIPNWNKIMEFSVKVAEQNHHHRLLALDISLTPEGEPVLIEENVHGFSYWLLMFTGQSPFGNETKDIIQFCEKRKIELGLS